MKNTWPLPLFLALTALLVLSTAHPASAITRVVVTNTALCPADTVTTPCYSNPQNAIDAAADGDTILIKAGIYVGNFLMSNKSLTIAGAQTATTFLSGGGGGTVLTINPATGATIVRNLTFINAAVGISIRNTTSSADIKNNIFEVGTGSIAVQTLASPATTIGNNMFYLNASGIASDTANISIFNNVFFQGAGGVAISPSTMSLGAIQNNSFNGGTIGVPNVVVNSTDQTDPNNKFNQQGQDPLFVDPDNADATKKDFHLKSGSPCQDTGNNLGGLDSVDGTAPDIGVYGGSLSDTIPNSITGLSSSGTTSAPFSITLVWSANPAYTVAGYKVYYGRQSGVYNGTDAVVSGTTQTSPINAGNVTTLTLDGLSPASTTPAAPVLNVPSPQNGSLLLSWSSVANATGYNIHYHEISPNTGPTIVVPVNSTATSYTLGGLTNGHCYAVQVSAVVQSIYFLAVTAHDSNGLSGGSPGVSHESAFSTEQQVAVGPAVEGPLSGEVQGAPDILIPAPNLQNTGCFIATAAFDSADAAPVRILRHFRDRYLATNTAGRAFISWYYRTSPRLAEALNRHPGLKPLVRIALEPFVAAAFVATEMPPLSLAVLLISLPPAAVLILRRRRAAETLRS